MLPDFLHWRALTYSVNQIIPPETFLLDTIFRNTTQEFAESIKIELIQGSQRLAPFVTIYEGGVIVDKTTTEQRSVTLPRMRPKKSFPAPQLLGGRFPGMNPESPDVAGIVEARNRLIGHEQQDMQNTILRAEEWMAAQALQGTLTVDQENINFAIDFRLPSTHKKVLAGKNLWDYVASDYTGNPFDNLEDWAALIASETGFAADTLICGTGAAKALLNHPLVKEVLNLRNYNAGTLNRGNARFIGELAGIMCYRYTGKWVDKAGVSHDHIPSNMVILLPSNSPHFVRHYGLIQDLGDDVSVSPIAQRFFSKAWIEKDPSLLWMLLESRPLPVPHWPEQVVTAVVSA